MRSSTLAETLALGAVSGMRAFGGPAALTFRHRAGLQRAAALLAAGEMVADKLPFVPARVEALPLSGRALSGALVGGVIAREEGGSLLAGAMLGAAASVGAAVLAYQVRRRSKLPNAVNGIIEDLVVVGIAAYFASASRR